MPVVRPERDYSTSFFESRFFFGSGRPASLKEDRVGYPASRHPSARPLRSCTHSFAEFSKSPVSGQLGAVSMSCNKVQPRPKQPSVPNTPTSSFASSSATGFWIDKSSYSYFSRMGDGFRISSSSEGGGPNLSSSCTSSRTMMASCPPVDQKCTGTSVSSLPCTSPQKLSWGIFEGIAAAGLRSRGPPCSTARWRGGRSANCSTGDHS